MSSNAFNRQGARYEFKKKRKNEKKKKKNKVERDLSI